MALHYFAFFIWTSICFGSASTTIPDTSTIPGDILRTAITKRSPYTTIQRALSQAVAADMLINQTFLTLTHALHPVKSSYQKVEQGLELLSQVLPQPVHVDYPDNKRRTNLHYALSSFTGTDNDLMLRVVQLFVQNGASVNAQSADGRTALHRACSPKYCYAKISEPVVDLQEWLEERDQIWWSDEQETRPEYRNFLFEEKKVPFNKEVVALLCTHGASVLIADSKGNTPLHEAVVGQSLGLVELLLEKGAAVDRENRKGWTPVHHTVALNRGKFVDLLERKGADVKKKTLAGSTVLHLFTLHDKNETHLESESEDPMNISVYGSDEYRKFIRHMVSKGVSINAQRNDGKTALHRALEDDLALFVYALLEEGADHTFEDASHKTVFDYERNKTQFKQSASGVILIGYLVRKQNDRSYKPIHAAAQYGFKDLVASLLMWEHYNKNNPNVNAPDSSGKTPLDRALENGHVGCVIQIVDFILSKYKTGKLPGAYESRSAVDWALGNGHVLVAEALLKRGDKPQGKVNFSDSYLCKASSAGCSRVLSLVLNSGINANGHDEQGMSALMHASLHGHTECITILLDRGALVHAARDSDKSTSLHFAALNGHILCVILLIKKGADKSATDAKGLKPLDYAKTHSHIKVIEELIDDTTLVEASEVHFFKALDAGCLTYLKALIKAGVNPHVLDSDGNNAFHHAVHAAPKDDFDYNSSLVDPMGLSLTQSFLLHELTMHKVQPCKKDAKCLAHKPLSLSDIDDSDASESE